MKTNLSELEIGVQILQQNIVVQDGDAGQGGVVRLLRQLEVQEPVVQLQRKGVLGDKLSKGPEHLEKILILSFFCIFLQLWILKHKSNHAYRFWS